MDVVVYALCKKLIADGIKSLGDVFEIKGNKDSYYDLPEDGNKNGDVWLVGPKLDGSYDEYYWSSNDQWELMGSTIPDMSPYITDVQLYMGNDYSGTVENPAEGTIIYTIYQMMVEQGYITEIEAERRYAKKTDLEWNPITQ